MTQLTVSIEDVSMLDQIRQAISLLRGVRSVSLKRQRKTSVSDDKTITPALRRSINKARQEYANGETISCSTPEEMQQYFDNL